jgi:hypothetical protein
MFRETNMTTGAIIELIRTLPEKEQKVIAQTITKKRKTKRIGITKAARLEQIKRFEKYVSKNRVALPKGFKFNREEIHER